MEKFKEIKFQELEIEKVNDFETAFTIQPLEQGFGLTLGNALRRILLSSVSSLAPFAVKIKNVSNEFTTIEGITEDVVNIILNIKAMKFKIKGTLPENEFITISLNQNKKGQIFAKDLDLPINVEIVNPDALIATCAKPKILQLEIFLRAGRGFYSFQRNKEVIKNVITRLNTKIESGEIIAVDSLFSPIDNVEYHVQELNSISEMIEEQLLLKVRTNGTISAHDALREASLILRSHLAVIENISSPQKDTDIFHQPKQIKQESKIMNMPIEDLELSVRSFNALKRKGISKISDLATMSHEDLEVIEHLGKKSIDEIDRKLEELGIRTRPKGV